MANITKWNIKKLVDVYQMRKDGVSAIDIAAFYGVSYSTIRKVIDKIIHVDEVMEEINRRKSNGH